MSDLTFSIPVGSCEVTVTFKRISTGALFDPGAPVLHVKDPSAVASTASLVRQNLGVYKATVDFSSAGTWKLKGSSEAPGEITETVARVEVAGDDF